ncbi:FAD-dependent monooxygenase [Salinicoccus bachuensis]|uniref:FAD-dependent monooxygenase n=1 Tax=Salinicoccus bachuensis TaxID=3136731 RepID=A0ABZ3CG28_9STAP
MEKEVLIVGAGPTGLALAIGLERHGVPFRLIEQHDGPGTTSRAMVVHARTLEFYRQFGLAHRLVEAGIVENAVHIYKDRMEVGTIPLGEMGTGISPYPYLLSLAQDVHESILVEYLGSKGVRVEWQTKLMSFEEKEDHIEAEICSQGEASHASFAYVCGCDGAHSTVRHQLGLDFPGGTYSQMFFVADAENTQPFKGMSAGFRGSEFNLALNIRTTGTVRLIGVIPPHLIDPEPPAEFDPLIPHVESVLPVKVGRVNWYSPYKVHHRVAESFRRGRTFILGDAAHIHSPAGGQGMNTGIGDAFNLAWKLALVMQGRMDRSILDTYEPERIAFARKLVATTDRIFREAVNRKRFRNIIMPHVLPKLVQFSKVRRMLFKVISQTRIRYPDSPLSEGKSGRIEAGDRLPWIRMEDGDNFEPLVSVDWQLHVYGHPNGEVKQLSDRSGIPLHHARWTKGMKRKGIRKNAAYLIRPDGHVGVATTTGNVGRIEGYIKRFNLKME